jgi:hypothetical protein
MVLVPGQMHGAVVPAVHAAEIVDEEAPLHAPCARRSAPRTNGKTKAGRRISVASEERCEECNVCSVRGIPSIRARASC